MYILFEFNSLYNMNQMLLTDNENKPFYCCTVCHHRHSRLIIRKKDNFCKLVFNHLCQGKPSQILLSLYTLDNASESITGTNAFKLATQYMTCSYTKLTSIGCFSLVNKQKKTSPLKKKCYFNTGCDSIEQLHIHQV